MHCVFHILVLVILKCHVEMELFTLYLSFVYTCRTGKVYLIRYTKGQCFVYDPQQLHCNKYP